jgi:hypothetical protein
VSYIKRIIKEEFSRNEYRRVIKQLLKKYVGGRPFFDALDEYIKTHDEMMVSLVKGLENEYILSSGTFGDNLYELYEKGLFKCKGIAIMNGKICTKKKGVTCWYPSDIDIENKEFYFVDDSTFSGRTIRVIDQYLKKHHNSKIKGVSVAYDGSKTKDSKVHSLYRYYDYH